MKILSILRPCLDFSCAHCSTHWEVSILSFISAWHYDAFFSQFNLVSFNTLKRLNIVYMMLSPTPRKL